MQPSAIDSLQRRKVGRDSPVGLPGRKTCDLKRAERSMTIEAIRFLRRDGIHRAGGRHRSLLLGFSQGLDEPFQLPLEFLQPAGDGG